MIGVLCPAHGNPRGFERMVQSVHDTAPSAVVLGYIEEHEAEEYAKVCNGTQTLMGPLTGFVEKTNALAQQFPRYSAYVMAAEDIIFQGQNWDSWLERTLDSFPGRIGVVSPHHNRSRFCNFPAVSREWVETLGHVAWPLCRHYTVDTMLQMLGEDTDIVYSTPEQMHIEHEDNDEGPKMERIKNDSLIFLVWCLKSRNRQKAQLNDRRLAWQP